LNQACTGSVPSFNFEVVDGDATDESVSGRWSELHRRSDLANLYNSWDWMGIWSRHYAVRPSVVFVSEGSEPIGAFVLVQQRIWRRIFPLRVAFVGPCSSNRHDLYLEHNQLARRRRGHRRREHPGPLCRRRRDP
jgi:hypothetical protein